MAPEIEFASSDFPPSHKTASYAGYFVLWPCWPYERQFAKGLFIYLIIHFSIFLLFIIVKNKCSIIQNNLHYVIVVHYLLIIIIIIIIIIIMALPRRHFHRSGSSSIWGTNGFTSLSKDGVAKEGHLNIQPHGQAGNRTRDLLASSQRSFQLS